jgi:hypothetical protein
MSSKIRDSGPGIDRRASDSRKYRTIDPETIRRNSPIESTGGLLPFIRRDVAEETADIASVVTQSASE